jgi:hypothetical protein
MTAVSRLDQSGVKRGANLLVALRGCLSARTAAPCLQQRLFRSETTAQARRWDKCGPVPPRAAFFDAEALLDADFWPGSFGERREFSFAAGHLGEASALPVAFGLVDPRLRARNEIPPDVPLAVDWRASEEHNASVRSRARSSRGFGEYQDPAALGAWPHAMVPSTTS